MLGNEAEVRILAQGLDKSPDAIISAGRSDNMQHFRPLFITFSSESEQYSKTFRKFAARIVCHENKSAVCRVAVRNFRRDGSRPTAYGVQALFANHFMLL